MAKIVTANTLATGLVVFLGRDDNWVTSVEAAKVFPDAETAEQGLAVAQEDARRAIVVDPFVTNKNDESDGKPGMSMRDRIRAQGPTIQYLPQGAGGARKASARG